LICSGVNSSKTLKEIVSSSNSGEAVVSSAKNFKKAKIIEVKETIKPEFKTVSNYKLSENEIQKQAEEIHNFIKDFEKPVLVKNKDDSSKKEIKKQKVSNTKKKEDPVKEAHEIYNKMAKEVNIDITKILHSESSSKQEKTKENKVDNKNRTIDLSNETKSKNTNKNTNTVKPSEELSTNTEVNTKSEVESEFTVPGYDHHKAENDKKSHNPAEFKEVRLVDKLDEEIKKLTSESIKNNDKDVFFAGIMKKPDSDKHVEQEKVIKVDKNSEIIKTKDIKEDIKQDSYKERLNELETIVKSIKKEVVDKNTKKSEEEKIMENAEIRPSVHEEKLKNEETVLIEKNLKNLSTKTESKVETTEFEKFKKLNSLEENLYTSLDENQIPDNIGKLGVNNEEYIKQFLKQFKNDGDSETYIKDLVKGIEKIDFDKGQLGESIKQDLEKLLRIKKISEKLEAVLQKYEDKAIKDSTGMAPRLADEITMKEDLKDKLHKEVQGLRTSEYDYGLLKDINPYSLKQIRDEIRSKLRNIE